MKVIIVLLVLALVLAAGINLANTFRQKYVLLEESKSQLTMSDDLNLLLNQKYNEFDTEFASCLAIEQHLNYSSDLSRLDTYYEITGIHDITVSSGKNYIQQKFCEFGNIHSHKGRSCHFSLADIYSEKIRFKNGEMFAVLMCGQDEFYYITRNNYEEKKLSP